MVHLMASNPLPAESSRNIRCKSLYDVDNNHSNNNNINSTSNISNIFNATDKQKPSPLDGLTTCRKRVPLWLFLLELLELDKDETYICWTLEGDYEFHIKNPDELAAIWGQIKENKNMSYSKLSRAVRYYYGKDILEKVQDKPFTYQFVVSHKTRSHLPPLFSKAESGSPSSLLPSCPQNDMVSNRKRKQTSKPKLNRKRRSSANKAQGMSSSRDYIEVLPKVIKLEKEEVATRLTISNDVLEHREGFQSLDLNTPEVSNGYPVATDSGLGSWIRGTNWLCVESVELDKESLLQDISDTLSKERHACNPKPELSRDVKAPAAAIISYEPPSCADFRAVSPYQSDDVAVDAKYQRTQEVEKYLKSDQSEEELSPARSYQSAFCQNGEQVWTVDDDLDLIDSFLSESTFHC